ncbi:FeoB-associated Cys-rich membrane protein [Clostridium sp. UBA4548]|nr:FeoB-associated Cys-rich membrane protein [Clostridium sp. UBA4548]
MEIIITVIILASAGVILYRNLKRKAQGKCECGSCNSKCPKYDERD